MRIRRALLAIVLASCGEDTPPPAVDAATEPDMLTGITQMHNNVRAAASATDPLLPLVWSASLAATAEAWVKLCRDQLAPMGLVDHNNDRSMGHPYYVGENIFGAGGTPDFGTAERAVTQWAAEGQSYDYATNTCAGTCGHYTQIVWRATLELGCALADCPSLSFRASLVCNYGPGGNTGGQRPY